MLSLHLHLSFLPGGGAYRNVAASFWDVATFLIETLVINYFEH